MNEIWKLEKGFAAGYTEDKELIKRIRRYKPKWHIMAEYFDTHSKKRKALQYKIPIEEKRQAERMFKVKMTNGGE